ncbi:MAG: hypothetical protein LC808_24855 [Actinobacteria bacterium]|nr:hypothetical protein [Actinomycetota bacterium]
MSSQSVELRCPNCGSERIVPMLFGLPAHQAGDAWERGELELGGCMAWGDERDPHWHCKACGHEWFDGRFVSHHDAALTSILGPDD